VYCVIAFFAPWPPHLVGYDLRAHLPAFAGRICLLIPMAAPACVMAYMTTDNVLLNSLAHAFSSHRMFTVLSVTRNSIPRSFTRTTLFKQVRSNAKIGSSLSSTFSTSSPVNMSGAKQLVQKEIQDNFVMVFSKSYCPVSSDATLSNLRHC
jgi:hypothetical protein